MEGIMYKKAKPYLISLIFAVYVIFNVVFPCTMEG